MNGIAIPFVYADTLFTESCSRAKTAAGGAVADVLSVAMLVNCDAELLAKNSFDAIHVVFHEREFFFHVCHPIMAIAS